MSWIQNLFQRLKNEEDDEEVHFDIHSERREQSPSLPRLEMSREIEARISFQYPKSALRIPAKMEEKQNIPLEPVHNRKREQNSEIKKREQNFESKKREQFFESKKREQYFESKKPEQNEEQLIKVEVKNVRSTQLKNMSRPFQPTVIPSPIFGFERPKNKPNIVEHELSHFYNEEEKTIISNEKEKPIVTIEEEKLIFLKEEKPLLTLEEEKPLLTLEEEKPIFSIEEESVKVDSIPLPIMQFNIESIINEALEESKPESQLEVPQEFVIEKTSSSHEEESEEKHIINKPPAVTEQETPRPKRTHLPFNVMMLKQDKIKWEERKRNRNEEKPQNKPIENLQLEKQQELPPVEEEKKAERILPEQNGTYELPGFTLLNPPIMEREDTEWIQLQEDLLNQTLINFNVGAKVVNVTQGPSVTRFEVQPEPGVKVNKITNLSDDIKLSLAARDIRIEAPIPGKHTIGIEVPNQKSRPVLINEIIQSDVFNDSPSPLTAVLGLDIAGKPIVTDLKKMPHGLIAGATGSGKSVCINSILVSLLYKASPEDLRLLLIDPKVVELAPYNKIPHLVSPVISDVKAATASLKWAVDEMERRYELFAHTGVRDINRFNELAMQHKRYSEKLPFIVIIIDELADLMMMSPADVEEAICRIAQKARACGIHLIVATQRPSVDVITGLIKANIPTRIAFSVSSQIDSRTIIDISGAEKLLGRGDMLFLENGSSKPVRLQGTFVSDEEIDLVVAHVSEQQGQKFLFEQDELLKKAQITEEEDELFYEACEFIISQGGASTSSLQRRFKIGYNRAARLMDMLESNGFISGANGSKPREVLITEAELESLQDTST